MLREIDCKPGVEVIAIKQMPFRSPPWPHSKLQIGSIYTICVFSSGIIALGRDALIPNISLNEIPLSPSGGRKGYFLECFKLRDPFELDKLFNLDNIDKELLRENYFANC